VRSRRAGGRERRLVRRSELLESVDAREMRSIDIVWERCDDKAAAVKVARRLLAENAHRFSEDVTIEAELFCDLEWQPSGADDANESVAVDAGRSAPR
jgi:hypothetical protein